MRSTVTVNNKCKIKKGDRVQVISGGSRGHQGDVLKVLPKVRRLVVQGANVVRRHVKATQADPEGGIKTKELPIHISNVQLIDAKTNKPTRVGYKIQKDGTKVRIAKRSGEVVEGK